MAVPSLGSILILQFLLHFSKSAALDSNWVCTSALNLQWDDSEEHWTMANNPKPNSPVQLMSWTTLMTAILYKFRLQITKQLLSQHTATLHVNCPLKNLKCFNFLELFTRLGDHRENFLKRVRKATAPLQPEEFLQTDCPSVLGLIEGRAWGKKN